LWQIDLQTAQILRIAAVAYESEACYSNNAMLLLLFTQRERQSTFWNDVLLLFHQTFGTQQHRC